MGIPITSMPPETTVDGTEIIPSVQGGVNRSITMAQVLAYLESVFDSRYATVDTNPLLSTLQAIFPVGSIYFNSISNTNPATLFGFGTWVAIQDRFLIGAGNSYAVAATGGEATHVLTVAEMPSHTHPNTTPSLWQDSTSGGDSHYYGPLGNSGAAGGGAAHNNMPPYVAVFIWKRTA